MSTTTRGSHLAVRALCEGAIMLALAMVLSLLPLFRLPNGGSVDLAMLPVLFYAVRWGFGPGCLVGFLFGLLQVFTEGAVAWGWQSILLDFIVAFTPLGLAGLFRGKSWGIFAGTSSAVSPSMPSPSPPSSSTPPTPAPGCTPWCTTAAMWASTWCSAW